MPDDPKLEALLAEERELDAQREAKLATITQKERAQEVEARVREKRNAAKLQELLEQFESEGEPGVDYQICDLTRINRGFVVVKRGPAALVRKFKSTIKEDRPVRDADAHDLVRPNLLYPSTADFQAITGDHDFVVGKVAHAICDMHGVGLEVKAKKY